MGRHIPEPDAKGSQGDLQNLVESCPEMLNVRIKESLGLSSELEIKWLSPCREDDFAEYSDEDFLEIVGLDPKSIQLKDFWPTGKPHWDALGRGNDRSIFLVEAKAYIGEIISDPSGAGEDSRKRIRFQLERTKAFLHAKADVDWTVQFFQYANRLSHLHFLRFDKNLPAFLVFLYFTGDQYVHGPTNKDEWLGAIELLHSFLGIGRTKLSPFITDVFIDVAEIAPNKPM